MPWGSLISQMLGDCAQPAANGSIRGPSTAAAASDMTVLERQQARLRWQNHHQMLLQQQQHQQDGGCYAPDRGLPVSSGGPQLPNTTGDDDDDGDRAWLDLIGYSMLAVAEPQMGNYLGGGDGGVGVMQSGLSAGAPETAACSSPPGTDRPSGAAAEASITSNSSSKKRKPAYGTNKPLAVPREEAAQPAASEPNTARKRIKTEGNNNNTSTVKPKQEAHQQPTSSGSITAQTGKEDCTSDGTKRASSSKASDAVQQKPDYIHVRARRGQATDSHSLAERVRREKISERMKYLQELVPGCNKITGKAGMLDEIINYVQSLQKQVEFLSMKLAAVNPLFDATPDGFPMTKEKACSAGIPLGMEGIPPQLLGSAYFPSNPLLHMATCGIDTAMNLPEAAAVLNGAVAVTQPLSNAFGHTAFSQLPGVSPGWNADLQCFSSDEFRQAKASLCAPFSGVGAQYLQMQM